MCRIFVPKTKTRHIFMADNTILNRLDGLKLKYEETGQKLTDPEVIADVKQFIATDQGVQGAGADHRDFGTLPHGHRQPRRSQGHAGHGQGRGDARNGPRDDRRAGAAARTDGGGDQAAADPQGPAGLEERHRGDPRRNGRRRGGASSPATCCACTPNTSSRKAGATKSPRSSDGAAGGFKEVVLKVIGTERLRDAQIRVGRAPRAARAADRDAGPRAHLGRVGGRAARSRGVRHRNLDERHPQGHLLRVAVPAASRSTRPIRPSA